jgi:hypothetical protein
MPQRRKRLHGDRSIPPTGAEIVGRLFPRSFAWIIRTGSDVNRAALAAAIDRFQPSDLAHVRAAAIAENNRLLAADRYEIIEPARIRGLMRAAKRALLGQYGNHGNARAETPKSKLRIAGEARVIRIILQRAAVAARAMQPTTSAN